MHSMRNGSRRRVRRVTGAAVTLALTLGLLVACGGSGQGGEVTLRVMWWGNPPRHQATNEAIKLYEKKHPNVAIEPIYTGWDGYWDKLATQMAGGSAPDVVQMDYAYLNDYAARGTLLDLSSYTGKALDVSGIDEKLLQSGKIEDGLYAIPWSTNTQTLTMDADAVKKAGLTLPEHGYSWQELREFCQKLNAANGKTYAISDMSNIPNMFEIWLESHGKALYTESGELGFTKQDLHDYWTYWQELSKSGVATPADVMTPLGGSFDQLSLVRGSADVDFLWDNQFSGVAEFVKYEPVLVPLPSTEQGGQYLHPSMFLSASARTEYPEEAAEFINFMVTNKKAGKILGTNRGIPADKTIRDMLASKATGLDKKVFAYEESLADKLGPTPPAPPKGNSEIETLFGRMGENVAFGRMSVDQAVNTFFTRAENILSQ